MHGKNEQPTTTPKCRERRTSRAQLATDKALLKDIWTQNVSNKNFIVNIAPPILYLKHEKI